VDTKGVVDVAKVKIYALETRLCISWDPDWLGL
jgi:hypothetical protein